MVFKHAKKLIAKHFNNLQIFCMGNKVAWGVEACFIVIPSKHENMLVIL
jgi:hypothetical protein